MNKSNTEKSSKEHGLSASFTVEASWVIGIAMTIFCTLVVLGFEIFKETIQLVENSVYSFDAVSWFRKGSLVSDLLSIIK